MRAEIEIELGRMRDANVDSGAGWYVSGSANLFAFVVAEQSGVVTLLYGDERNSRPVFVL